MTLKMSEDGGKTPHVVVLETAQCDRSPKKVSAIKKRLILGVGSFLVAVFVIAAILIGVKFFLDAQKDIVKQTFQFADEANTDKVTNQEITTDKTEKLLQYHLKDEANEVWVIEDYNRDIKLLKTFESSGGRCFVTPLNGSDETIWNVRNATSPTGVVETVNTYYNIAQKPIKQKSILGPTGEALCDSIDVYWMTPACNPASSAAVHNRRKRFSCGNIRLCYWCGYPFYWSQCCNLIALPCTSPPLIPKPDPGPLIGLPTSH